MFLHYADEFGHDGRWDPSNPRFAHHPLFGLAGFAIPAEHWHALDRGYFRLKCSFYAHEIARAQVKGMRPERYEMKDLTSRRDVRFTNAVLNLLETLKAHVFVHGIKKNTGPGYNSNAVYGSVTQGLMRAYEKYIRQKVGKHGRGLMILDRRSETSDVQLLSSAQSYLFSANPDVTGGFSRLIEVPLLVRSDWHHAVQAADTVARAVGRIYRYRALGDVSYQKLDAELGPQLDKLEARYGNWTSMYVK